MIGLNLPQPAPDPTALVSLYFLSHKGNILLRHKNINKRVLDGLANDDFRSFLLLELLAKLVKHTAFNRICPPLVNIALVLEKPFAPFRIRRIQPGAFWHDVTTPIHIHTYSTTAFPLWYERPLWNQSQRNWQRTS